MNLDCRSVWTWIWCLKLCNFLSPILFAGGRQDYQDWFENDNPLDAIINRLYNSSEDFWPSLETLESVSRGEKVILTNRRFVQSKSVHHVFGFSFDVLVNPLEMITERGFPLLKPFSELIMRMIDAGIIDKLRHDFAYNASMLHFIRDRSSFQEPSETVLTSGQMSGAFIVWTLGLVISTIAFFAELFVSRHHKRYRARRNWKLLRNSWRQVTIMRNLKTNKQTETKTNKIEITKTRTQQPSDKRKSTKHAILKRLLLRRSPYPWWLVPPILWQSKCFSFIRSNLMQYFVSKRTKIVLKTHKIRFYAQQ